MFKMVLITAYTSAWKRSFDFKGRSSRAEYWWFILATNIVIAIVFAIANATVVDLTAVYSLASLPATAAVTARRLHDAGKTTFPWIILFFIPLLSFIFMLVFFTKPSIPA
jgi:uncharacterized membrane protein YhaH (DUF805 family)